MKRYLIAFGAAAMAAAAIAADSQLVEGIVVRVNDRILTTADMRKKVAERAAETGAPVARDDYPQLVEEAAGDLCLLERAIELKVEVTDEEVNEALKSLREQNKIETDEQFEKMVKDTGMTMEQLRAGIRDRMLINRTLSREVGSLPITDEELRQRYERERATFAVPEKVHLQHLMYPVGAAAGDDARVMTQAQRLVAAARSGTAFEVLLKQETESGAATGGDLGVVAVGDLRPEVLAAVQSLQAGGVSDPFKSAAGVHVIRLVARTPTSVKPFAEVAEELRQRELAERYRARMRNVVDDLKKRYVVEVHPELFKAPAT